ncbi:MAG: hypothetical protein AUH89_01185 [Ktedonobacter sp. 13_1_40CM_4_52_4]|nr:MAG: hypothetical protein AUH89_01185 [Ktedonobacter sp. 13_1_40CM_4_52_4]OLE48212.1 MAG: hypothetical protein AUI36_21120 [Cyanobacteria bacterium 13_1_40CM_2_61_4]
MPTYVSIAPHLSVDDLEYRYRKASDPVERSHIQIVWLLAQGKRVGEVSLVTGYCANWIRQVARRYNREGAQGLGDQRHHNPGATPFLSLDQQKRLRDKLEQAAPDGGLWTGQKVALWMSEQTERKIHPQRGWDYLKRVGFSLQIPRPRHHKAEKDRQEAFKRDLPEQTKQIRAGHIHRIGWNYGAWMSIG